MRATRPAGKALMPETVMPHGSNPTTTAAAGTPGRATCTITAPSLSITSMGGSQHWASETWARTNCRCSRSACSSKDRASPHIQVDRSRGPMRGCPSHKNGTWGRPRGLQRDAPKERQDPSARGCRLPPPRRACLHYLPTRANGSGSPACTMETNGPVSRPRAAPAAARRPVHSGGGTSAVRGPGSDPGHDRVHPLPRGAQGPGNRLLAQRHALDAYDLDVGNADEAEHKAQVRLLEVGGLHRSVGIDPAAREDEHALLSGDQALRPLLGIRERAPRPDDVIDPGLQRRRDPEVVHRYRDHAR